MLFVEGAWSLKISESLTIAFSLYSSHPCWEGRFRRITCISFDRRTVYKRGKVSRSQYPIAPDLLVHIFFYLIRKCYLYSYIYEMCAVIVFDTVAVTFVYYTTPHRLISSRSSSSVSILRQGIRLNMRSLILCQFLPCRAGCQSCRLSCRLMFTMQDVLTALPYDIFR